MELGLNVLSSAVFAAILLLAWGGIVKVVRKSVGSSWRQASSVPFGIKRAYIRPLMLLVGLYELSLAFSIIAYPSTVVLSIASITFVVFAVLQIYLRRNYGDIPCLCYGNEGSKSSNKLTHGIINLVCAIAFALTIYVGPKAPLTPGVEESIAAMFMALIVIFLDRIISFANPKLV